MGQAPAVARLRYLEKAQGHNNPSPDQPPWIRVQASDGEATRETRDVLRKHAPTTSCEEAASPNTGECLRPTRKRHDIARFVTPDEFAVYKRRAEMKGFSLVSATPLTRSSYLADENFYWLPYVRRAELRALAAPAKTQRNQESPST